MIRGRGQPETMAPGSGSGGSSNSSSTTINVPPEGEKLLGNHIDNDQPKPEAKKTSSGAMGDLLKYGALVILVLQNSALALTMRYSRTTSSGQMYITR